MVNRDRKSFGSCRKNCRSCWDDWHRWCFWSAFRHFGTHFTESFRMSKSSWMMDSTRSREMPSCSAIYLAEIRQSSKISLWIWSIISGVVTVLGRPGRGATFLSEWCEFSSAPFLAEKKNLTARVSMLLKSRAAPDMLPFSLCNKKRLAIRHMNRPLFPTTPSIRPMTSGSRSC